MSRINLWLKSKTFLSLLLQSFQFFFFLVFEDLNSFKKVFIEVIFVTLRDNFIRSGVDLWLKSAISLGLSLNLLLLVLHFELSLKLPLLLMLKELIQVSLLACFINLGFECWLKLIWILFENLLINLCLLDCILDLLITDYLLISFMYGHVLISLLFYNLMCLLIDLWLLPKFLELSFST